MKDNGRDYMVYLHFAISVMIGFMVVVSSVGGVAYAQQSGDDIPVGQSQPVEEDELEDRQVLSQLGQIEILQINFSSSEEVAEIVISNTGSSTETIVLQDVNSGDASSYEQIDLQIFRIDAGETLRVVTPAQRDIADQTIAVIVGSITDLRMVELSNEGVDNILPENPTRGDLVQAFVSTGVTASLMIGVVAYTKLKREKSILKNVYNSKKTVRPKLRKLDKSDNESIQDIGRERRGYLPRASETKVGYYINRLIAWLTKILPVILLIIGFGMLAVGMNWVQIPGINLQIGSTLRMFVVTIGFGIVVGYISSAKVVNTFLNVPKEYVQSINAAAEDGSEVINAWEGHPILMADLTMEEGSPRLERVNGHTVYIVRDFDPYTMTATGAWQGELDDVDIMTTRKSIKANRGNIRKWANIGKTLYANLDTIVENVANEFWRSKSDDLLEKSTTEPDIVRNEVVDEVEELTDSIETPEAPSVSDLLQDEDISTEDLDDISSSEGDESED